MDKDSWIFAALIGIGLAIVGFAVYVDLTEINDYNKKCQDAGGVPSRYSTTAGKIHRSERVCLHPSAIIELK